MKITRVIVLVVVFVLMLIITLLCFSSAKKFLFGGVSSADYMLNLADVNLGWPVILLVLYSALAWYYYRKPNKFRCALGTVFILWIFCGRMLGTLLWPDGTIVTGWYYIPTDKFNLCYQGPDCETVVYYQTQTEKLPFWLIRIKNKSADRVIFVGPFVWNKALVVLKEIGNGKYTK